jgi:hypothetical protein
MESAASWEKCCPRQGNDPGKGLNSIPYLGNPIGASTSTLVAKPTIGVVWSNRSLSLATTEEQPVGINSRRLACANSV